MPSLVSLFPQTAAALEPFQWLSAIDSVYWSGSNCGINQAFLMSERAAFVSGEAGRRWPPALRFMDALPASDRALYGVVVEADSAIENFPLTQSLYLLAELSLDGTPMSWYLDKITSPGTAVYDN